MVAAKHDFGRRLKEAFDNATNGTIAEKIGVGEGTVGFYVRGRVPDADILIKIANATGRSIDWLLTGKESTPERVVEKSVFDPIISRDALTDLIREVVRQELATGRVQELGTIDEFLAESIRKHDNPLPVLEDWYRREGWPTDEISVPQFKGWDKLTLEQKVRQIKAFRNIETEIEELHEILSPQTPKTSS